MPASHGKGNNLSALKSKYGVLLIDDDRTILAIYSDALREAGFEVMLAESAEDGLAKVIEQREQIDVVIVDIMLVKMNGWQFLDYVRKDLNLDEISFPVIVMSAVESVDLDMEYMRHHANDWVIKPVQPLAKLVHKVKALLGILDGNKGGDGENNDDATKR